MLKLLELRSVEDATAEESVIADDEYAFDSLTELFWGNEECVTLVVT